MKISSDLPTSAAKTETHHPLQYAPKQKQYTHWQDLAEDHPIKILFQQGKLLANSLYLVALEDDQPVLIGGGGYSQANIQWLAQQAGVRTFIDLRGQYAEDQTDELIYHSPAILADYQKRHQEQRLRNLSPDQTRRYINALAQEMHLPLRYIQTTVENPQLLDHLESASRQNPLVMFCQYGINRSGKAWAAYAARQGWRIEEALNFFGVPYNTGYGCVNSRDIEYGYSLHKQ